MVLLLNNQDLESALDMPSCIEALYQGLKSYGCGDAVRRPRIDLFAPTSRPEEFACFSSMEGVVRGGYYAIRIKPDIVSWPYVGGLRRRVTYSYQPGLYGGIILLFRVENAELVAIMNDGYIQHMRVGATAALGAKYLARNNATTVGILGSGGMARSFALGFAAVREVRAVKAYSPNKEHLLAYCREMSEKLGIEALPTDSSEQAIQGSDIAASCTNSQEAVLNGQWLEPGMHVAHVSNRELDQAVLSRITQVGYLVFKEEPLKLSAFADDNFELRAGVMAYIAGQPPERQKIPKAREGSFRLPNARWAPCVDWATDTPRGRESEADITLLAELANTFPSGLASCGIQGVQFASVAGKGYERAVSMGLGIKLDHKHFLQDIPT
ncbi:MAG: ornithine cyclodeaminase family protein [Deltaproteobacteria bacterium]|nr:ornithine cyclodeaminase family protein [Deltaproteobacteria bacterium]